MQMNKMDDIFDVDYLRGGNKPLQTDSSILISSSKYLNHPGLRDAIAHDCLRKHGHDLPFAYVSMDVNKYYEETVDHSARLKAITDEKARIPEFAAWLDERYFSNYRPEDLAGCAPGTLGAEVYEFMTNSGLTLDFVFRGQPMHDDFQYYITRGVQSHDIEHMVTGLDPSPVGEIALVALKAAVESKYFSPEFTAFLHPMTGYMVGSGIMKTGFHYPKVMPAYLDGLRIGTEMASRIDKPLFYVKWEKYWNVSIAEIREDLNFSGFPPKGIWDWTYEGWRG
jgi:ubiquinone biosynthesis protein COQ4